MGYISTEATGNLRGEGEKDSLKYFEIFYSLLFCLDLTHLPKKTTKGNILRERPPSAVGIALSIGCQ